MSIKRDIPQISALRKQVEQRFGSSLMRHSDFVALVTEIEVELRTHISETTLERVWGYSTRGYDNVSLHTLNLLSLYAKGCRWSEFCETLHRESGNESGLFNVAHIATTDLQVGNRIRIGWLPDRECEVRYLGNNRFIAEQCKNSKMQSGDTFSCLQFTLGHELQLADFKSRHTASDSSEHTYIVGQQNGLTTLSLIGSNE